jgi:hypothetical protein
MASLALALFVLCLALAVGARTLLQKRWTGSSGFRGISGRPQEQNPAICGVFRSALGRTRTCDLLIRSQSRSRTRSDTEVFTEGQNYAFVEDDLTLSKGQGETRGCGSVVV